MMRVPVEVRARYFHSYCIAAAFAASLLFFSGCAGVVSRNATTTPPPTPPPQGQTYTVSGTISPNAGGSGATVTLSGASSATTTANSSGGYTFAGLANGTYAVTPSRSGYTFSPTSQNATISGANVSGINFTASLAQAGHTATASWTASSSAVLGYNVYRGTVSGGPYTKVNGSAITALGYPDASVVSGQTYFYVATAVDASGNESVFSNEVKAVIP